MNIKLPLPPRHDGIRQIGPRHEGKIPRDKQQYDRDLHAELEKALMRIPGPGTGQVPFFGITDAERLANVKPTNYGFLELEGERYGVNASVADNSTALANLVAVIKARGGGLGKLPAGELDYATGLVFDADCIHLVGAGGDKNLTSASGTVLNFTGTGTAIYGDTADSCGLHDIMLKNGASAATGLHCFNSSNWYSNDLHIREFTDDNLLLGCDTTESCIYNTFVNISAFKADGTANGLRMYEGAGKATNNNNFHNSNFGSNLYGIIQDDECHDNSFSGACELGSCTTGAQIRGRVHFEWANMENCTTALDLVTGSAYGVSGSLHFSGNTTDVANPDGRPLGCSMQGGGAGNLSGLNPTNTGYGFRGRVPPSTGGWNLSTTDGSPKIQRADVDHLGFESGLMRAYVTLLLAGAQQFTGVISPAQITANTNNYNPTGLAAASTLRLSTDASRNLTGIVAQPAGTRLLICNVGGFDLVLTHDATSTAANRFFCPGSAAYTLNANDSVQVQYDSTDSRWRVLAAA